MKKLRIGYQRYTSCSGCQLTFLNCEEELSLIESCCDIVDFSMVTSARDTGSLLDVALAEGSISSTEELQRLLELRRRTTLLVAVGACALTGGVNRLSRDREELMAGIYGPAPFPVATFPPQPLARFVKIDAEIVGCPPEGSDFLRLLGLLQQGGLPGEYAVPVCMECRLRENLCLLLERGEPCLGPVTRGGCLARCPSYGVVCEGCRGEVPEANDLELTQLLLRAGLSAEEIRRRMERFTGEGR